MARDVLVILAYSVDYFYTLRTVTDHQCRFYAISSLVDLISVPYRTAQLSCPSCIHAFRASQDHPKSGFPCRCCKRPPYLPDCGQPVPSGPLPLEQDQKETSTTIMVTAVRAEIKLPGHCGKTGEMICHPVF